ncbi:hypothetical protein, partial [Pseudomonas sp. 2995-1]|uniref:hypothetical protein n=1 Tax=Pseudomonas sp. 2995-1 TaxID=1712679 RepID=UPI001304312B
NEETVEQLKESVDLSAVTYEIFVGDLSVGHLNVNKDIGELIDSLILEYVSEEELLEYYAEGELEGELDTPRIVDISFSEDITWEESTTDPEEILSLKEAIK